MNAPFESHGPLDQAPKPGGSAFRESEHALDFLRQGTSGRLTEALLTRGLSLLGANKVLGEFMHQLQTTDNIYATPLDGP